MRATRAERRSGGGGSRRALRVPAAVGAVAAMSMVLTACGGSSSPSSSGTTTTTAKSSTPISVGFILPLTGNFAANAKLEEDGFKLGLKQFGSTIDGHKIEVHYADSHGTATTGLSVAKTLVTATKVQVMEGPLISSTIAAVSPYVIGKGIPEDDLYLSSPTQMNLYKSSGIGLTSGWTGYSVTSAGANWAYKTEGWKSVTTLGGDFSFGWQTVGGFDAAFTKLGGKIDKAIWIPSNATTLASYISQIPQTTGGVFIEVSGNQAVTFIDDYASYGLKGKVPLLGITQMTTQSALPSQKRTAALGSYTDSQYCDGATTATNQKFATAFHSTFGAWPGYYSDAGYVKAEILVTALKSLKGNATTGKKLSTAMRAVNIKASRGPVTINKTTWSPTQNAYICKVETVNGTLRNVPVKTYKAVPPWGLGITKSTWLTLFTKESSGPPPTS